MTIALITESEIEWPCPALGGSTATVFIGPDSGLGGFEVLVASLNQAPTQPLLKEIHSSRLNRRSTDLIVVVEALGQAWLFGPDSDRAAIQLSSAAAQRALQATLDEADTLASYKRFLSILDAHGTTEIPGVKNKGLFASYHIRENVPHRKDWAQQGIDGERLSKLRHRELIEGLGFSVSNEVSNALILTTHANSNRAVAVLLNEEETFEGSSSRFPASPVSAGLSVAQHHSVPWLIVLRKEQIRLYPGRDGVGVGQKGQVETFFELDLATLDDAHLALLPLVFSADSLDIGGVTEQLLSESSSYAASLGARLRERVYEHVVPQISTAIALQLPNHGIEMDTAGLQRAYSLTLRLLFRLLFQAYAEDRGLLPAGRNERYDANSLKTIAQRDKDTPVEMFSSAATIWNDLIQVWDAIDEGSPLWQVPAYNGGLFGSDPTSYPEGALLKQLRLPDSVLGPALQALLIDLTEDGVKGPVDFRSLSVREFGTIYEGLLESSLSLAESDLTVDSTGAWVPSENSAETLVTAGTPYFHSSSGERKATGSYFTPKFVVDHLIERSIDPSLDAHLERIRGHIEAGDHSAAARDFFDYRVADLAMGSGHFLVAAIDRIESRMRGFLAEPKTQVPGVIAELNRLRAAAVEALGRDEAAAEEIEDPSLLRRQIARRCIYGLDVNPLAVELARLAIWIHTFVPGLPMSSLDHGLVCANSLTGIGTIDEALDALEPDRAPGQMTFFDDVIATSLASAKNLLIDAANASEANKAEVAQARTIALKAKEAAEPTKLIFDAAVAARTGLIHSGNAFSEEDLVELGRNAEVRELVAKTNPAHLPYLFPEVFLRDVPGFDVLIGNPPWEKLHVDEQRWWGILLPGLRSMKPSEKHARLEEFQASRPDLVAHFEADIASTKEINQVISKGPYPGVGASHLDLFSVFAWRNYQLIRKGGRFGLVLPRSALVGSSLIEWRKTILSEASFEDVCVLSNSGRWVFEAVHPQYTVSLTVVEKTPKSRMRICGPFFSMAEFADGRMELADVSQADLESWSSNLTVPLLPSQMDADILRQMLSQGKMSDVRDNFEFRPYAELNATSDKGVFEFEKPADGDFTNVYGGSTYNLWNPDVSAPYAFGANPHFRNEMRKRFEKSSGANRSAYSGLTFPNGELPYDFARISYRQITNQTNTRTTIACLIPPNTAVVHSAPTLVRRAGGVREEAFLLGVVSSIPFDWATRRWVELNLTMELMSQMPIPLLSLDTPIADEIAEIAGRLGAVDDRFKEWARELGIATGSVNSDTEKDELLARLDALVALAFGLTTEQVEHLFMRFHRGWNPQERLTKVLSNMESWSSNER